MNYFPIKKMNKILYLILFAFLACSSPTKSEGQNSSSSNSADFSGYLELTIDGETYKFDELTRSGSRVSFQDEAIAVYVENPNGEGTIAQVTLLSPEIYEGTSHKYVKEAGGWKEIKDGSVGDTRQNLSFKFRRIDNMNEENYINLDLGTVEMQYDEKKANFELIFEGEDRPSSFNKEKDEKLVKFSGKLVLNGAYLMDSRD